MLHDANLEDRERYNDEDEAELAEVKPEDALSELRNNDFVERAEASERLWPSIFPRV